MRDARQKVWFRVKRQGYGVGLPVAWQGWLLLALFIAAVALSAAVWSELVSLVVLIILTPIFIILTRRHSDAEWRWRDGR